MGAADRAFRALPAGPIVALAVVLLAAGLVVVPVAAHAATADGRTPPTSAAAASPVTGPPALAAFGSVTGVVRGNAGRGVAGVCVTVSSRGVPVAARTGATGQYDLPGLRPGLYSVRYTDCADPARSLPLWQGDTVRPSGAMSIEVWPGRPATAPPVSLTVPPMAVVAAEQRVLRGAATGIARTASISGTVRNARGQPVPGICVNVWFKVPGGYVWSGDFSGRHGQYTMDVGNSDAPIHGLRVEFTAGPGCEN
jgi:Carboxypeptidase regulatory-like domain